MNFSSFKTFILCYFITIAQSFVLSSLSPSSLPEKDLYQQANVNTSEGQGREGPPFKCEVVFWRREMIKTNHLPARMPAR